MTDIVYTLEEIKQIAQPIAQRYGIAALYLFGSYVRNEATPQSDIDFRVDRSELTDLLELGGLFSDLEDAFQKRVHVVTTQMLSPDFLNRICTEEFLIYGRHQECAGATGVCRCVHDAELLCQGRFAADEGRDAEVCGGV